MGLVGLVTDREPPARRASHCDGPLERHLSEAGVMLAVAEWMFGLGAEAVEIHPDGMHVKQFDMCGWLASAGFEKVAASGKTREAGRYTRNRQSLTVDFRSGRGDVVGDVRGCRIVVEAKGGCINTRHPGQVSKLRRHLYEAVGRLLSADRGRSKAHGDGEHCAPYDRTLRLRGDRNRPRLGRRPSGGLYPEGKRSIAVRLGLGPSKRPVVTIGRFDTGTDCG